MASSQVTVHALRSGNITLPERFFIHPHDTTASRTCPSLSFLIQHQTTTTLTRLVFDLGLRRDLSLYPPQLQKHCASRSPISVMPDVTASLAEGGLGVDDIDYVILSHVHYDHIGMPSDFSNPKTKFIVGNGALDLFNGNPKMHGSHSVFEPGILPLDRTVELPPTTSTTTTTTTDTSPHISPPIPLSQTWTPLDPFPHALDLFSDSTLFILSAPGHLPGHINLLAQLSEDKYVILAGDACHDMRLFTGERDIATWTDDEGNTCCIHHDIPRAKETIARLAKVQREGMVVGGRKVEVEVVFAHNEVWEREAVERGRFWPGMIR